MLGPICLVQDQGLHIKPELLVLTLRLALESNLGSQSRYSVQDKKLVHSYNIKFRIHFGALVPASGLIDMILHQNV